MNLAVPAIVVFFVLLPGFIFRSRLKLVEKESQDFSPFGQIVAGGVIYAGILHTIVLLGAHFILDRTARLDQFVHVLVSPSTFTPEDFKAVADSAWQIAEYFGVLFLISLVVPSAIRKGIISWSLDRYGSPLSWLCRFHGAPWYYLLSKADFKASERPELLISVSAIVEVAGQAYLYTGFLDEYFTDKDGQLDRIVLTRTERRKIEDDKVDAPENSVGRECSTADDDAKSEVRRFYPITGDYFVIRYSEIVTLNIHYYRVVLPAPEDESDSERAS